MPVKVSWVRSRRAYEAGDGGGAAGAARPRVESQAPADTRATSAAASPIQSMRRERGAGTATVGAVLEPVAPRSSSARANSPALAKRSAGVLSSALATAASTASGTEGRTTRRWTGRSVMSFAIIAWALGPVTGGSPASISYSTAASE